MTEQEKLAALQEIYDQITEWEAEFVDTNIPWVASGKRLGLQHTDTLNEIYQRHCVDGAGDVKAD